MEHCIGKLLDRGVVLVPHVEVEFHPRRWMGTLAFAEPPEVPDGVYTLELDDDSALIETYNTRRGWKNGVITATAPFNPAKPSP